MKPFFEGPRGSFVPQIVPTQILQKARNGVALHRWWEDPSSKRRPNCRRRRGSTAPASADRAHGREARGQSLSQHEIADPSLVIHR